MAGKRRKARILALQTLFELDTVAHPSEQTLARLAQEMAVLDEALKFATELTEGVLQNRQSIDNLIAATAPAFPLDQIAAIDRNILRLAIYEVVIDNRVPMRAAINEAVELAKEFGGETSPRFINGVLGSISLQTTR